MQDLSTARLYTDFSGLAQLRAKASVSSGETDAATQKQEHAQKLEAGKEVARQFEAIFLQTMLKTMREASQLSESTDSDQTRFYQEMFDKQVAIDLAARGQGVGLAKALEKELNGAVTESDSDSANLNVNLVRAQLEHSASAIKSDID